MCTSCVFVRTELLGFYLDLKLARLHTTAYHAGQMAQTGGMPTYYCQALVTLKVEVQQTGV